MEFKFKRKYTSFFILAVSLHLIVFSILFFYFKEKNLPSNSKNFIILLSLINCEAILLFYLGLFKKKYYAYHDSLTIKRSILKTITIKYNNILQIKEKNSDTAFFTFGSRPSFVIYYTSTNNKRKKITIRADNTKLLLDVIKNEIQISKSK